MKKYLSFIELVAASSLKRVLAALGAMTVIELAAFYIFGVARRVYIFENAIIKSWIPVIMALGFAAVFWALLSAPLKGSRPDLSLRRLSVSPQAAFAAECVFCILCMAVFFLLQTVLIYVFALIFEAGPYFSEGPQGVFIDVRQNGFLHQMIPLWDSSLKIKNIVYIICVGLAAAEISFIRGIKRRVPVTSFVTVAFVLILFIRPVANPVSGPYYVLFAVMLVFTILNIIWTLRSVDPQEETI